MSDVVTRQERSYGLEEIERGLIAVAHANGNTRKAQRDLAEDEIKIPRSTLEKWMRQTHPERYEQIRAELLPKIREQTGDEHLALARRQIEASAKATEAFLDDLEAGKIESRDLSSAARNFDVGSGIHTQNSTLLHGEPTPRPRRTADEILRNLAAMGVFGPLKQDAIDVDATSEEDVTDAEMIEEGMSDDEADRPDGDGGSAESVAGLP